MGQQQLLLIVLGVIIVGIAVVVGINVFTASSIQANTDALIADCQTIGAMAQQFYKKPAAMGGGGNTFTGFVVPTQLRGANGTDVIWDSPNGNIELTVGAQQITIEATSSDTEGNIVAFTVNPNNMSVDENGITQRAAAAN